MPGHSDGGSLSDAFNSAAHDQRVRVRATPKPVLEKPEESPPQTAPHIADEDSMFAVVWMSTTPVAAGKLMNALEAVTLFHSAEDAKDYIEGFLADYRPDENGKVIYASGPNHSANVYELFVPDYMRNFSLDKYEAEDPRTGHPMICLDLDAEQKSREAVYAMCLSPIKTVIVPTPNMPIKAVTRLPFLTELAKYKADNNEAEFIAVIGSLKRGGRA